MKVSATPTNAEEMSPSIDFCLRKVQFAEADQFKPHSTFGLSPFVRANAEPDKTCNEIVYSPFVTIFLPVFVGM